MSDQVGRGVPSEEQNEAWRWTRRGSHRRHLSSPSSLASVPSTGNGTEGRWERWDRGRGYWRNGEDLHRSRGNEQGGVVYVRSIRISLGCSRHLHPESPALLVLCGPSRSLRAARCWIPDSPSNCAGSAGKGGPLSISKKPRKKNGWHTPPRRETRSPAPTERSSVRRPPPLTSMYLVSPVRPLRPRWLGK